MSKESKKESRLRKTQIMAINGILEASDSFKAATYYELNLVCNGCGAADAKFDLVPEKIWGTYIGHACHIHDWDYDEGITAADKIRVDKRFYRNICKIVKMQPWFKRQLMKTRAYGYYLGVKYRGKKAYWKGKR